MKYVLLATALLSLVIVSGCIEASIARGGAWAGVNVVEPAETIDTQTYLHTKDQLQRYFSVFIKNPSDDQFARGIDTEKSYAIIGDDIKTTVIVEKNCYYEERKENCLNPENRGFIVLSARLSDPQPFRETTITPKIRYHIEFRNSVQICEETETLACNPLERKIQTLTTTCLPDYFTKDLDECYTPSYSMPEEPEIFDAFGKPMTIEDINILPEVTQPPVTEELIVTSTPQQMQEKSWFQSIMDSIASFFAGLRLF